MSLLGEVWGQSESKTAPEPNSISIHITDENIKSLLKPYKKDYISQITEKALLSLLAPPKEKSITENFNCDSEQVTIVVLVIVGLLLLQMTLQSRS